MLEERDENEVAAVREAEKAAFEKEPAKYADKVADYKKRSKR